MTVVVGTAGHIDHGKTALLLALTGIDTDRLPEERRRGMTIDVGYAHGGLPDGSEIDFVDVPGHDRLIGNMLVGAGEIDAVMLVVAADDGPRQQTIEHLELIDALGIEHGIAVITKTDLVAEARVAEVREAVARLLAGTTLSTAQVIEASSVSGVGIDVVQGALVTLRDQVLAAQGRSLAGPTPSRLAIDRAFTVKGRGLVATGTLRGGPLLRNAVLRLVPGDKQVRAREVQVHGRPMETAGPGRTAVNLARVESDAVPRGAVLTDDASVMATDRLLVRLRRPLPDRTHVRVHLGTAAVDGAVVRSGRDALELADGASTAIVRLSASVAAATGDRLILRLGSGTVRAGGAVVLDVDPPRGISRRRQTHERVGRLDAAIANRDGPATEAARLDLHGAIATNGSIAIADDVAEAATADVIAALDIWGLAPEARPRLAEVRARCARTLRRLTALRRDEAARAASTLIDGLVGNGRLARDGDYIAPPGTARRDLVAVDPGLTEAMDRLARALAVASPPSLSDAARGAGCSVAGIRELQRTSRIVLLDDDLAYEAETYRAIEALALELARGAPLTPARFRDATGTSRKYVMAVLADLDRRGILRRTADGHVPGPRAASASTPGAATGRRSVIER